MKRIEGASIPDTSWELLEKRVLESPRSVALRYRNESGKWASVDWASLHARVLDIASALSAMGVRRETRVAILLPTTPMWELVANALRRIAAVVVGLDLHTSPESLSRIIDGSQVSLVITDSKHLEMVPAGVPLVSVDRLPDTYSRDASELDVLIREQADKPGKMELPPIPLGKDLAAIIYTSGTTGEAKGIGYRHEQIMSACRALVSAYEELGPNDRSVCWLPFAALFQRMVNLVSTACGMTTYYVSNPQAIFERLTEIEPTFFVGVPRVFEKLETALSQASPSELRNSLRNIKYMVSGSAPLPVAVLNSLKAMDITVLEAYGLSENTVPNSVNRFTDHRFGSVGKPLAPNSVSIANDSEILVSGSGVFSGYLGCGRDPELFSSDGFYRTGDLGHFDADGFLYLTGRKRDLIKTSTGRRIAPNKIEAVYGRCDSVDQIVVIGNSRKYLTAMVTLRAEAFRRLGDLHDSGESSDPLDRIGEDALNFDLYAELVAAGAQLVAEERIQSFGVLPRPFVVGEEVTTSQKLRRAFIAERFSAFIDRMYRHKPPCLLFASQEEIGDDT